MPAVDLDLDAQPEPVDLEVRAASIFGRRFSRNDWSGPPGAHAHHQDPVEGLEVAGRRRSTGGGGLTARPAAKSRAGAA